MRPISQSNKVDLSKKTCIITGATSGIGLVTAESLAQMGAELFLLCRNEDKAQATVEQITTQTGNQKINTIIGDLSVLSDVRRMALQFLQTGKPIHVLINNAGVFNFKRKITADGYEEMFAVNHLAPFVLTNLLLERMRSNAPARIINVASGAHMLVKGMNFEDLHFEQGFKALKVYSHSKLANILFTRELAKRLEGTGITTNSIHPGEISTGLGIQNGWIAKFLFTILKPFMQTPISGAQTTIYTSTSPDLEGISGRYFSKGKEANPKPWALDDDAALKLWQISERLTSLNPGF